MRNAILCAGLVAASLAAWPLLGLPQAAHRRRTIVINGQSGEAPIIESEGHSYVELESLARIANGSVAFQSDRIVLTFPTSTAAAAQPASSSFSKSFMRAALEELTLVREWRIALKSAMDHSQPITDDWLSQFRNQATDGLRRASVEAGTDADHGALQMLTNDFNNMRALSDKSLATSNARDYVPPDTLKNDPLYQKILTCARSLSSMISNGQFAADGSCP